MILARLKRDVSRIEANKHDIPLVYTIGIGISSDMTFLSDIRTPSHADMELLGRPEDYVLAEIAHKVLIGDLEPCAAFGARVWLEKPKDEVMEAYEACKSRIEMLEDEIPEMFVCPDDHPLCRMP